MGLPGGVCRYVRVARGPFSVILARSRTGHLPQNLMAIPAVTLIGTMTAFNATNTTVFTTTADATAGGSILLCVVKGFRTSLAIPFSINDSAGNVYEWYSQSGSGHPWGISPSDAEIVESDSTHQTIFAAHDNLALGAGSTITLIHGPVDETPTPPEEYARVLVGLHVTHLDNLLYTDNLAGGSFLNSSLNRVETAAVTLVQFREYWVFALLGWSGRDNGQVVNNEFDGFTELVLDADVSTKVEGTNTGRTSGGDNAPLQHAAHPRDRCIQLAHRYIASADSGSGQTHYGGLLSGFTAPAADIVWTQATIVFGIGSPSRKLNGRDTDLGVTQANHVFRAYRNFDNIAEIICGSVFGLDRVSTTVAYDAAALAAPTIAVDPWDNLHVWYHRSLGSARGYRSNDLGRTWTEIATHADRYWPRLLPIPGAGRWLFGYHDGGTTLHIAYTDDAGVTHTDLATYTDALARRFDLRVDPYGCCHLAYISTSSVVIHRYSTDRGASWSAAVEWGAAVDRMSYWPGVDRGVLVTLTDANVLAVRLVEEDGITLGAVATPSPAPSYGSGYPGALVEEQRDPVWFDARYSNTLAAKWSRSRATTGWQTPGFIF